MCIQVWILINTYIWTFIHTIFPPCNFWYANIFGFWFTQKISHLSHSDLRIIIKVQTKLNTIVPFFKRLHLLTSFFTLGIKIIRLFFLYFPTAFKTWRNRVAEKRPRVFLSQLCWKEINLKSQFQTLSWGNFDSSFWRKLFLNSILSWILFW